MSDAAALGANLTERGSAKIDDVDGDCRGTLSTAIAFVGADAEVVLEGLRNAVGQFLGARHHESQAAKLLRSATACVSIQECRGGEQHGNRVFADERADRL